MTQRVTVTAPCPGNRTNYVVIINVAWMCKFGIAHPMNIGSCPIFLHGLDANGNALSRTPNGAAAGQELKPREGKDRFIPPEGSVRIVMSCAKNCTGTAILEYDMPNS
ncbi:hypothetical protein [Roseococcus suduntuyensis]|uniref:Uncharacterized protein n=1 Tax=Roseococcus suduntuyensis TaxID=455361 RepID=A0A840AHQ7_9PROT|nr:hypothetical protein [Roseococcus suduntuyensis]MBB3900020.1 hypothetical protein [Roseococcus suduntuyensis]